LLLGRAGCFNGFCESKSSGRKATVIEVPVTPGPGLVAWAPGLNLLPNCWCFLWTGVEGKRWYACLHFLTRTSRLRPLGVTIDPEPIRCSFCSAALARRATPLAVGRIDEA